MSKVGAIAVIVIVSTAMVLGSPPMKATYEPPLVMSAVAPVFPPIAVAANISGTVLIEVEVNAAGGVISARGVSAHPLLRKAAENTARRWQFMPATSDTGARAITLTFVFRIMPKETNADELTPVFTPPYQVEVRHRPAEPIVDSDPPSYVSPPRRGKRRTR